MPDPRTPFRIARTKRSAKKELTRWAVVPVPTGAELRGIAVFGGLSPTRERLADVRGDLQS